MVQYTPIEQNPIMKSYYDQQIQRCIEANRSMPDGEVWKGSDGKSNWTCFLTTNSFHDSLNPNTALVFANMPKFGGLTDRLYGAVHSTYNVRLMSLQPDLLRKIKAIYGVSDDEWLFITSHTLTQEVYKVWEWIVSSPYNIRNLTTKKIAAFSREDYVGQVKVAATSDYCANLRGLMPIDLQHLFDIVFTIAPVPETFSPILYYHVAFVEDYMYSSGSGKSSYQFAGVSLTLNTNRKSVDVRANEIDRQWNRGNRRVAKIEEGQFEFTPENRANLFSAIEYATSSILGRSNNSIGRDRGMHRDWFCTSDVEMFGRNYYTEVGDEGKYLLPSEYHTFSATRR